MQKINRQHKLQLDTQYLSSDGAVYVMNRTVLVGIDPQSLT